MLVEPARAPRKPLMILFFDLDGPLLDVSPRYHALHRDLADECGFAAMDPDRYWAAKRARRSEEEILAELGASNAHPRYAASRLDRIETPRYVQHDRCWPWAIECLTTLGRHVGLVMVTARAQRDLLMEQLDALDLRRHFEAILSEAGGDRVDLQKSALIRAYLERRGLAPEGHWMIGDTEADVFAGRHAGIRTIAVLSGIRDETHLRRAEPDFLVPDIRVVPTMLKLPSQFASPVATSS